MNNYKVFNKLVRDKIPEIIEQKGEVATYETLTTEDFKAAVADKLVEEALEFKGDPSIEELADVFEVLDAILKAYKIKRSAVVDHQRRKRVARGGFEKRVFLRSTYKKDKNELY
jgi:predicted house-cleaning noncanonical NTP pyrophosphatase (MazG superfamily)